MGFFDSFKKTTKQITKYSTIVALGGPAAYYLYKKMREQQQNQNMTTRSSTTNNQNQQRERDNTLRPPSEFGNNVNSSLENQRIQDETPEGGSMASGNCAESSTMQGLRQEISQIQQQNSNLVAGVRATPLCAQSPAGQALLARPANPVSIPRCGTYPELQSVLSRQREELAAKTLTLRNEPNCKNLNASASQDMQPVSNQRVPATGSSGGAVR